MAIRFRILTSISLALITCLEQLPPALSCGPFFPYAVFSFPHHPDLPLSKYAEGQIGIIQNSLARSYLVVAYRYITDRPLAPIEQKAAVKLWRRRLATYEDVVDARPWLSLRNKVPDVQKDGSEYINSWATIPGDYFSYANLNDSAIENAATTLKARIAKYGIKSKWVQLWTDNQTTVFSNCGSYQDGKIYLPKDPGPNADALAQADFAYQTAAANLYAGKMLNAYEQFKKIAADKQSPWHQLASYLVARSLVQAIFRGNPDSKLPSEAEAEQYVRSLMNDQELSMYKNDLQQLLDGLLCRRQPQIECRRDAKRVLELHPGRDFEHYLEDYTALLDSLEETNQKIRNEAGNEKNEADGNTEKETEQKTPPEPTLKNDLSNWMETVEKVGTDWKNNLEHFLDDHSLAVSTFQTLSAEDQVHASTITNETNGYTKQDVFPAEVMKDDITDWLATFGATAKEQKEHALEKWKETKSLPWLVAALEATNTNDPICPQLIEAAKEVPQTSPAYLSVQYYSARMAAGMNKKDEARKQFDHLLKAKIASIPPSSRNMILVERQKLARNLDEGIHYGLKSPTAIVGDPASRQMPDDFGKREAAARFTSLPATFDDFMAGDINDNFPLSLWKQLTYDKRLPSKIHAEVVATTWMRAVLLGDNSLALELTPSFETCYPSIKPQLDSFLSARTPAERRFAACYTMLKAPGLSPLLRGGSGRPEANVKTQSIYGDNFWTPSLHTDPKDEPPADLQSTEDYGVQQAHLANYLSASEKSASIKENRILVRDATPNRFITEGVLAWAKINPKDSRLPEALYVAIKMPRWGCRVDDATKYSRAAFVVLHSKYPSSSWTARSPYYY